MDQRRVSNITVYPRLKILLTTSKKKTGDGNPRHAAILCMASLIPGRINVVITNDYRLDNSVMHDLLCQQQVILLYFLYLLVIRLFSAAQSL